LYIAILVIAGLIIGAKYAENKNGEIADPEDPQE
jgi:hypothetical protein